MSEPGAPPAPGQPGTVDRGVRDSAPPSVWAECTRCGQRSHISATSCPSCGARLTPDDEGDPTQAMPMVDAAPATSPPPPVPSPPPPPQVSVPPADSAALIAGLVRDTRVSPRVATWSEPVETLAVEPGEQFDLDGPPPAPVAADRPGSPYPPGYPPPPVPAPPGPAAPHPAAASRRTARSGDRSPTVLIGAGIGLGLLLLLAAGLISKLFGEDAPDTAGAPISTAAAISPAAITATASSTQNPEGGITYSAENTLDGRAETAWNSDGRADGKGPGMVLTYRFHDPVELSAITVLNGYQKTLQNPGRSPSDLFALNSRVRSWRVTTDSGSWVWDLADDRVPQTLAKQFGTTSSVRFEVLSVYPGSKYLDLAISEVSFAGLG